MALLDDVSNFFSDSADAVGEYIPEYELTGNLLQAMCTNLEALAPQLYTYVGQSIAYILMGIVFSVSCLVYAIYRLGKKQIPLEEARSVLIFVVLMGVNGFLGTRLWQAVRVLVTFITEKSAGSLAIGAEIIGIPLEPVSNNVTHPIAKLGSLLDAQIGNIDDMGFALLDNTNLWTIVSSANASASSYVFGFFIILVFGIVSFYYSFLILRSYGYLIFVFALSPIIVPCAGLKMTRGVASAAFKTVINALLNILLPTWALAVIVSIISATKRLSGCIQHFQKEYKTKCADEIEIIGDVFGIQVPDVSTVGGAIDFYQLLIGVGLSSIVLIFVASYTVSRVFGGPQDASPIAIIASSMAAIKTAGTALKGMKLAGKGTATLGAKGSSMVGAGAVKFGQFAKRGGGALFDRISG